MKVWIIRVLMLAAIVAGVRAFHQARQQREARVTTAARAGILLAGNGTELETLDPDLATGVPEHKVITALFEGLVTPAADDPDANAPGAAESWEPSDGYSVWTFKLRSNGRWSDGKPVTAQDFLYAYQRILSPALTSEYAEMLYLLQNAKEFNTGKLADFSQVGVKALDDYTLQLRLVGPAPYLPGMLKHYTWFPVPRHVIERFGGMTKRDSTWVLPPNLVGNGPFKLKEWSFNHVLKVERNPNYWDAATVKLNEIHFFPISSDSTEERSFQDGQLHLTNTLPLTRIPYYRQKHDPSYNEELILGCYFYRFNVTRPPFNNKLVRKALSLAVDRKSLIENVLRAGQKMATGLTPPGCSPDYPPLEVMRFDPVEARRLLAEAGYPDGKGFPKFELLMNTSEAHRTIAETLQEMWRKNLGIPAGVLNQEWQVYLSNMKKVNFDLCRAGWLADYPDPVAFMSIFRTGDGNNCTGWSNSTYDDLVTGSTREKDPAKRLQMLRQAEELLLEESPILPLYWQSNTFMVSPEVKGMHPSVLEHRCYKALSVEP